MSLNNVWLSTLADGLIRADQVIGVHTHRTPALAGKTARWLLVVVLPGSTGSGQNTDWTIEPIHRTLVQTHDQPREAPAALTRLLAQLDTTSAAGIITTITDPATSHNNAANSTDTSVRFRFTPFAAGEPGRHYDAEYL